MSIGASGVSNFPGGFGAGVTIRGMSVAVTHPGKALWVYNGANLPEGGRAGSDGNRGTFDSPFATLAFAVSQCQDGRGDIIFVKPGHAENISSATALTMSKAGVAVVGLGVGVLRPTFTLDTATTSTINVSANDVAFQNCVFQANFANIAALFTLTTAKGFSLDNCVVMDKSAILNFLTVVAMGVTDNACDFLQITRNQIVLKATSGVVNLVAPTGNVDSATIADNYYQSNTTNAGAIIPIAAGKVMTNLLLLRNYLLAVNAAGTATGLWITTNGTTNSGFIDGNAGHSLANTTLASSLLVTAGSGIFFGTNRYARSADKSAVTSLPALDT